MSYSCLVAVLFYQITHSPRTHIGKIIGYLLMLLARQKETGKGAFTQEVHGFHAIIN